MTTLVKHLIHFYQKTFFGYRQYARCKYHPSCSEYMLLALEQHGFFGGVARGLWRLLRCNPFSRGGLDLP